MFHNVFFFFNKLFGLDPALLICGEDVELHSKEVLNRPRDIMISIKSWFLVLEM